MQKMKIGLIQMGLKASTDLDPAAIRDAMNEAHLPMIQQAAEQGVQVLCFQEVFNQPYFCPSQDGKWYAAAERVCRRSHLSDDAKTGCPTPHGHYRARV